MKKKDANLIIILVALSLTFTVLGPVISLAPFLHAQVPLLPGQATQPPPAAKGNATLPPATQSNVTSGKATPSSTAAPTPAVTRLITNASGNIASLQNNQLLKPHGTWVEQFVRNGIWLLSGKWVLVVPSVSATQTASKNTTSPTFNAAFSMVLLNGTAKHSHKISDFHMTSNPAVNRSMNSTTFRGTATVTLRDGPHTHVPIVITLLNGVLQLSVDRLTTDNHFGYTPIFGTVTKLG
jgi:hypothetical protein